MTEIIVCCFGFLKLWSEIWVCFLFIFLNLNVVLVLCVYFCVCCIYEYLCVICKKI